MSDKLHKYTVRMANYTNLNEHEQKLFCLKMLGKFPRELPNGNNTIIAISNHVKLYINAKTIKEKETLWELFDDPSKFYADPERFVKENRHLDK